MVIKSPFPKFASPVTKRRGTRSSSNAAAGNAGLSVNNTANSVSDEARAPSASAANRKGRHSRVQDMKQEINRLKTEVASRDVEIANLRREINRLKTEVASRDVEIANLRREINRLKTEVASRDVEIANLRREIVLSRDGEIAEWREAMKLANAEIEMANAEIERMKLMASLPPPATGSASASMPPEKAAKVDQWSTEILDKARRGILSPHPGNMRCFYIIFDQMGDKTSAFYRLVVDSFDRAGNLKDGLKFEDLWDTMLLMAKERTIA
eukprot:CAMPEP_0178504466 /NCGR_PEP_ID=MMETSP0696-20121128/18608_1 /TAXON_ID=265572 /ORGANISM="Extubocellulus spinifer, Strain CCMP396" /LENGTH=268 /DNA_ID=CAMNT_0020133703 /DNA_START=425 /DNA_END=1231 /DNA_ORIENTATION=-